MESWIVTKSDQHRCIKQMMKVFSSDQSKIGYGQSSVENLQNGGTNSGGEKYEGLGRNTLEGSTTISDPTKPMMEHRQETDSKGTALGKVTLDKTRIIQDFVDLLEARLPQNAQSIPKFGIPSAKDWEIDRLVDGFCSLTRADLELDQNAKIEDSRQKAMKTFNHPDDFLVSCIYAVQASKKYDPRAGTITALRQRSIMSGIGRRTSYRRR